MCMCIYIYIYVCVCVCHMNVHVCLMVCIQNVTQKNTGTSFFNGMPRLDPRSSVPALFLKAFASGHVAVATTPFGCQSIRKPQLSGIINQCVWLSIAVFITTGLLIITFHLLGPECSKEGTQTNQSTQRTNHPITVGHALHLSRSKGSSLRCPLHGRFPNDAVCWRPCSCLSLEFFGVKSQNKTKTTFNISILQSTKNERGRMKYHCLEVLAKLLPKKYYQQLSVWQNLYLSRHPHRGAFSAVDRSKGTASQDESWTKLQNWQPCINHTNHAAENDLRKKM